MAAPMKRTMVKDRVACVRTSTFDLPGTEHVYGLEKPKDPEGAGAIISNWITANPSEMKVTRKMTVYQNVLSIKHGCVTAKAMRQFSIDHPNIRLKETLPSDSARIESSHEGPFGIKTKFAEESMGEILQAKFTDYTNDDGDYPDVSHISQAAAFPRPKQTIASEALLIARQKAQEKADKKHFCMKRFQNIPGKLNVAGMQSISGSKLEEK